MKKIGLIVNPVAGIGAKAGLKGSDGEMVQRKALSLGAVPESGEKALVALSALKEALKDMGDAFLLYTCPGRMGATVCEAAGLSYAVVDLKPSDMRFSDMAAGTGKEGAGDGVIKENRLPGTMPEDTILVAKRFVGLGVDLLLFAGGDGTASDIMDAVGTSVTVLGIPAGCKIHSGVFALNPRKAGELAARYVRGAVRGTKAAEVMDIDEEKFRKGSVQARLYGYLNIPDDSHLVQNRKSGSRHSEQESIRNLAEYVADGWEKDTLYIVGGGSTTECIMERLRLPNTLLGVDIAYNHQVIASDCGEREILEVLDRFSGQEGKTARAKILVTVIGGQGYLFGRGNQQISAEVIRHVGRENIIVVASKDKMLSFLGKSLYADTGDEEVNRYLTGYLKVIVGYGEYVMMKVSA